jgi:hypothetical protein
MSRWFRFHSDAMRNPKVARLSDKEFRLWVELLSVASENDGTIPCLDDLKHILKRRLDHLSTGVERLISMRLIVVLGDGYAPHGWSKYQYKSDTSTDRVQKFRAKRNVSVTPPDTDTDTDTEKEESKKGAYAFSGSVIRLTKAGFENWRKAFSNLDLLASLQNRDDWLSVQDAAVKAKWFQSTSSWLAKKNQEALAVEKKGDAYAYPIA